MNESLELNYGKRRVEIAIESYLGYDSEFH